jgi:hypothetical protein
MAQYSFIKLGLFFSVANVQEDNPCSEPMNVMEVVNHRL